MSVTRIIAKACWLCDKPIVEEYLPGPLGNDVLHLDYALLLNGEPAHATCANRATKERMVKEEAPG